MFVFFFFQKRQHPLVSKRRLESQVSKTHLFRDRHRKRYQSPVPLRGHRHRSASQRTSTVFCFEPEQTFSDRIDDGNIEHHGNRFRPGNQRDLPNHRTST